MSRSIVAAIFAFSGFIPFSGFAQQRVSKSLDGVTVTLPADEADLADQLLKLATVWQEAMRRDTETSFPEVLRGYLLSPKAADNLLRDIARFTGLKNGPDEAIRRDWEEVTRLAMKAVDAWKVWQHGFDTMHFWTKKEAAEQAQHRRDQLVFQDISVQVRDDGAGVRLRPSFLPEPIDLDALPDDPGKVAPQRLDLVLVYPLGSTPGQITRKYNDQVNEMLKDPEKGALFRVAAELYEAMFRWVFERALQRMLVTDEKGDHFRKALSLGFETARNEVYNPKRGRKFTFGERVRNVAAQEWEESIEDLTGRMRNAPAWPAESDGPAEEAVREVALAMVFLSLKDGGSSLDGWIRAQEKPLDSTAFSARLDKAAGEAGWEKIFRDYCGKLADQFVAAFAEQPDPAADSSLSVIEQEWPRSVFGRVEVVHRTELAETARLTAEMVDAILTEHAEADDASLPPPISEEHVAILKEHGLHPRDRSVERWNQMLGPIAGGELEKLRVRFWYVDEALEALKKGTVIPGMELDRETGDVSVTLSLHWEKRYGLQIEEDSEESDEEVSALIIPIPKDDASRLPAGTLANAMTEECRKHLADLFESAKSGDSVEERFYLMARMLIEETLVRDVIAGRDREWFSTGFANWLAIRVTDAEYGAGTGQRVFAGRFPPEKNNPDRDKVDLLKWLSSVDGSSIPFEAAHAYFATLAVEEAFRKKDAALVKKFIDEIRRTPRKRTNMGTVYRAFGAVGGGNLKSIAEKIAAE